MYGSGLVTKLDGAKGTAARSWRHLEDDASETGTSTPTLLARSRPASVRSLERYARPGPEAIAAHVAASDPAARRRPPVARREKPMPGTLPGEHTR